MAKRHLEPHEYQSFDFPINPEFPIKKNRTLKMIKQILRCPDYRKSDTLYAYTHHEVFLQPEKRGGSGDDAIMKQTRSGPNWQGGIMTLTTCKQLMRTWNDPVEWLGKWFAGFAPRQCADNALIYFGRVAASFDSNYALGRWLRSNYRAAWRLKQADEDPRGDIYTPKRPLSETEVWDVNNFHEPEGHTRSVERYKDGSPKWWKDIRFNNPTTGVYPSVFVFNPAMLWSKPMLWTDLYLGRSGIKTTLGEFVDSLTE